VNDWGLGRSGLFLFPVRIRALWIHNPIAQGDSNLGTCPQPRRRFEAWLEDMF